MQVNLSCQAVGMWLRDVLGSESLFFFLLLDKALPAKLATNVIPSRLTEREKFN